ncbi:MAG: hypothetical protein ACRDCQ_00435, partial [Aeromonas sobria]
SMVAASSRASAGVKERGMSFGNRIGRSISVIGAEHHQSSRQDGAIVPQSAYDYQLAAPPEALGDT